MTAAKPMGDFCLGQIEVTPQHNQLKLAGKQARIQPKVMAVLCYLASHHDQVTSTDQLIDAVWEGRVVTHGSVQKAINALRTALNELAPATEFIQHYSKRGYQIDQAIRVTLIKQPPDTPNKLNPPSHFGQQLSHKWWMIVGFACGCALVLYALSTQLRAPSDKSTKQDSVQTLVISKDRIQTYPFHSGEGSKLTLNPVSDRAAYTTQSANKDGHVYLNIQNGNDPSWQVSVTEGLWVDLAWSPSGRSLAAVELWRDDERTQESYFFQTPLSFFNFQIFTLDFKGNKVIETNRLSQWQGKVFSVDWWDENTLEFVATQGAQQYPDRYRYHIPNQSLSKLPNLSNGFVTLKSRVHNQNSALLGYDNSGPKLKILGPSQTLLSEFLIDSSNGDISWSAKTAQVLLFLQGSNKKRFQASLMAPSGAQKNLIFEQTPTTPPARLLPVPRTDAFYFEAIPPEVNLQWRESPIDQPHASQLQPPNNLASIFFSPDGGQMIGVTEPDAHQLVLLRNANAEHIALSTPKAFKFQSFLWDYQSRDFLIQSQDALWEIATQNRLLKLRNLPIGFQALHFNRANNQLLALNHANKKRNLWLLDNKQEKPLTFGKLGSIITGNKEIYFQYSAQKGLWSIHTSSLEIRQINATLPANIKFIHADNHQLYYITGGPCDELGIFTLNVNTGVQKLALQRSHTKFRTEAFHPSIGVIEAHCIESLGAGLSQ